MHGNYQPVASTLLALLTLLVAVFGVVFFLLERKNSSVLKEAASPQKAYPNGAGRHSAKTEEPSDMTHLSGASTLGWTVPYLLAMAFLLAWSQLGLISASGAEVSHASIAIFICFVLTLPRLFVLAAFNRSTLDTRTRAIIQIVVTLAIIAAAVHFARLAVEVPWNDSWAEIDPWYVFIEDVIIALVLLTLYFALRQCGAGLAIGIVAMLLIGIANYFVFLFKNAAITPADLLALGTAAEVSGGYTYIINAAVVQAIVYACTGITVSAYAFTPQTSRAEQRALPIWKRVGTLQTVAALVFFAGLVGFTTIPRYGADFGISLNHWLPIRSSSAQGFFPCFVKEFQALRIQVPDGYSDEAAQAAENDLVATYDQKLGEKASTDEGKARAAAVKQFASQKPSVVVVMNESYSDASSYSDIKDAGYRGTWITNDLSDALVKGDCYTSIYGGGTCNTEFEALCGVDLHYLGSNKYPYTQWDFSNVSCLPRMFDQLGYKTLAMHPNEGSNWNRTAAYRTMGFDKFLTIDDFSDVEYYHRGVSDKATYEKILEELSSTDKPLFVHDVTMANHSPYTMNNIPADEQVNYSPADTSGGDGNAQLNEYIACINRSDKDLSWFVGQLRKLDKPVVLLFFGDHQPSCMDAYNDASNTDENEIDHAEHQYHTQYFIWANYKVAGTDSLAAKNDESSSVLGDVLMQRIGAPLTNYQKATLASRLTMPIVNLIGYKDSSGTWNAFDDEGGTYGTATADTDKTLQQLGLVAYKDFGSIVN